jgi:hemophore-related protein
MLLSGTTHRAIAGVISTVATTGAMLFGSTSSAFAEPMPAPPPAPPPPGCTAADLALVSGGVATATSDYLFSHPDVNNFFTSLRGLPNEEIPTNIRNYMDTNHQVRSDLTAIRQPLTDLRTRCEQPPA